MNINKIITFSIIAGILSFTASCSSKKEDNSRNKAEIKQAIPVKTMILKKEKISRTINYTATLIPFKEVYLAPATPGKIEKIYVKTGDFVKKGQIVAVMNRTNLEQAKLNLINLETNYKRSDTLKKTNTISDQQYDQVKTAYEAAKVSYQFLLDNTQLKAPFSGVISGKYFENNENFSGAPNTKVGKSAIVKIVKINELKALIGISESYFPQIKEGMKVTVKSDVYPDINFEGEIFQKYPTIDNTTKTFTVEIKIHNKNLKLRPGMFAEIKLNLNKGNAVLVPTIALIKQTGTDNMYVFMNKNNIAVKQPVTTGRMIDDKTEITKGLKEGNEIIVVGQNKLKDQTAITIIK